jgi:acyl carrier protein
MEINHFIKNFSDLFENCKPEDLTPSTKFRDIEGWSSIIALSVLAMIDEEYGIIIKGNDIINSSTIEDLFQIVKSRS